MARSEVIGLAQVGRTCVLIVAVFAIGCGGGGPGVVFPEPRTAVDDEAEAPADRATAVASAAKAAQVGAEIKKPKAAKADEEESDAEAAAAAKRRSARRAATTEDDRPADLAEWTHNDYRAAKLDRDSRLVQAVLLLGRASANADDEAKLLVELLTPMEVTDPRSRVRGMGGLGLAVVVRAGGEPVACCANRDQGNPVRTAGERR